MQAIGENVILPFPLHQCLQKPLTHENTRELFFVKVVCGAAAQARGLYNLIFTQRASLPHFFRPRGSVQCLMFDVLITSPLWLVTAAPGVTDLNLKLYSVCISHSLT